MEENRFLYKITIPPIFITALGRTSNVCVAHNFHIYDKMTNVLDFCDKHFLHE